MNPRALVRLSNYTRFARRISSGLKSARDVRPGEVGAYEFDRLGRRLGRRQLLHGQYLSGLRLVLNPVALVRYFEFDFCARHAPPAPHHVLDVSSPRLFPLRLAQRMPTTQFVLCNPDPTDVKETRRMVALLALNNVRLHNEPLDKLLDSHRGAFDFVTCISVIEHITGAYDDSAAFRMLLELAAPGGTVAITVPLSKHKAHEDEFYPLGVNPYPGTHAVANAEGRYFFQRLYSRESIEERLLRQAGDAQIQLEWWGELERDSYKRYRRGPLYGWGADGSFFRTHFRQYDNFEDLPGMGICGICLTLPSKAQDANNSRERRVERVS